MELIFSSEHDVAAFIGNITMDVSKVIVSVFVTKVVVEITKLGVTKLASTLAFSAILPIPVGMVIIVTLGVIVTLELFLLDEKLHLSHHLIESIKKGMDEHRKIMEWNLHNSTPYLFSLTQGHK
jgi:hypothetical protein